MNHLLLPVPAWLVMWSLCAAIFFAFKAIAWTGRPACRIPLTRKLGFWLGWPGMDAARFCDPAASATPPTTSEWLKAAAKTVLGAALIWLGVRLVPPSWELAAGWVGMIGLAFLVHFGVIHLISLAWRSAGVDARPIMNAPHRATSLAEFWSRRWNLAFRDVANPLVFRPVAKRFGTAAAMWSTFAFSGIVHEAAISVSACGGFGLPTAYFLLQAVGIAVQRSGLSRRLGLDRGPLGWSFTLFVTALPAFWLFHSPFVRRVMLPFLQAVGAL